MTISPMKLTSYTSPVSRLQQTSVQRSFQNEITSPTPRFSGSSGTPVAVLLIATSLLVSLIMNQKHDHEQTLQIKALQKDVKELKEQKAEGTPNNPPEKKEAAPQAEPEAQPQ